MNLNPPTAPTVQDYHRQNEIAHWARRRAGDDAQDECGCEGELIPVLAEMHARFARARARVDAVKAAR